MTNINAISARLPAIDRPLDPQLIERFRVSLSRLFSGSQRRLGLAVSGGPDSMALLALAGELMPDMIAVATVNHGLRTAAADECSMVADACAERKIDCTILKVEVASGNVQQEARRARYVALEHWARDNDVCAVATAHHADDQAETFLMRLNRGSGVGGLAGIRAKRMLGDRLLVIRPLLGFRRRELERIVAQSGLPFADDPSNEDERYDRVRIRKALAQSDWLDAGAIARCASHLAEADATLDSMAKLAWQKSASSAGDTIRIGFSGWTDIDARMLVRAIGDLGGAVSFGEASSLVVRLDQHGAKANMGGILVENDTNAYVCRREPPRNSS